MSLLERNFEPHRQAPEKMAANRLIQMTKQTYDQMVNSFNQGSRIFWQNPMGISPEAIAAELGTDAKEVFELHAKLGALLASVKPTAITEGASLVGQFTMNEDGTVTIIPNTTINNND